MKPENLEELEKRRLQTLTVLFGGETDCPEFGWLGDVVTLEEVTM